jgi:predicted PurR-regulated permease PerM
MAFLDTDKQRAAILISLLAIGVLIALLPYATGLIGAPVLYVLFAPLHRWLAARIRPGPAAIGVILCAFLIIVLPGVWLIGLLVGQAQGVASTLVNSPLLARVSEFRIGRFELGPELAEIGRSLINWLGTSALGFIGTATHFTLNLLLSFFGLYYLLVSSGKGWETFRYYVPFSEANAEALRERFRSVTLATVLGTGVTALLSGLLIGFGFWVVGLSNPVFWGVITVIFAILPVVGSGIVWIPGVVSLALGGKIVGAVALAVIGIVAGQIGTPIHSYVVGRYTRIHPMVTLVGAIAGISYFGLLGILIGPLALSYFFEMIRMYREEYVTS